MKYVFPAVFTLCDDGYDVEFPDLRGCHTCAGAMVDALEMAEDALETWLWATENDGGDIPAPSQHVEVGKDQFLSFVKADTDSFRRKLDSRAIRKTITLPAWLNCQAEEAHINLSEFLHEALIQRLKSS